MIDPMRIGQRIVVALALACAVAVGASDGQARADEDRFRPIEEALAAWDVTAAEPLVAAMNEATPSHPHALFLTGHLHLMQGRYDQAVEFLHQAVSSGAHRLAKHYLQLAQATGEKTKDYVEHTTADGRFIIRHAPGPDAVLVPYAEAALARAHEALTDIFDYTPDHPVRIEIYPQVDVLGAVSPLTVPEIRTSGTIALCKYNRLMITSPRDLVYGYDWLNTLTHEYIHLLITKKSRNSVPIWLHEGLAKYYEGAWQQSGDKPALSRHSESLLAKALELDSLISFEAMSPSMAKLPSQEATATAFAEVFTVIEYLNMRHNGDAAAVLVDAMAQGKSDREAVAEIAGVSWDAFPRYWKGYLKGKGYKAIGKEDFEQRLLFKGKDDAEDELMMLRVDKARDYVWLGDQMRLKKRFKAAAKEYVKATEYVGNMSPLVQGKLGFALLRQSRFDDAVEALEPPLTKYPRHVVLRVYLGEALLKLGRLAEARKHLEFATTLNPFDPDLHRNLAQVYEQLGGKRACKARTGRAEPDHPMRARFA